MKNILIIIGVLLLGVACRKSEIPLYKGGEGLYFNDSMGDSTNYSFANQIEIKTTDTIFLKMQAMGELASRHRKIQLVASGSTNATEGIHYKLPEVILPANHYTLLFPVILYNVPELKEKTFRLELKVASNSDFVDGAGIKPGPQLYIRYTINFNNRLIQPDYWGALVNIFGEYSDVKYRFMIETLGISNFRPDWEQGGTVSYSDFLNYAGALAKALDEYIAIHGPLLDESGKEVDFPL